MLTLAITLWCNALLLHNSITAVAPAVITLIARTIVAVLLLLDEHDEAEE